MRMGQLGTRGGVFSLYKPASLAQRVHFSFPPKTDYCVSLPKQKMSHWSSPMCARADCHRTEQNGPMQQKADLSRADQWRAEQSCLAGEGPGPIPPHSCAIFTAVLHRNLAVFHWILFSSPHPKLGISVGVEMLQMTIGFTISKVLIKLLEKVIERMWWTIDVLAGPRQLEAPYFLSCHWNVGSDHHVSTVGAA